MLGHKSISMTDELYTHLTPSKLRDKLAQVEKTNLNLLSACTIIVLKKYKTLIKGRNYFTLFFRHYKVPSRRLYHTFSLKLLSYLHVQF